MSKAVPINPIITPITWRLVDAILNTAKPSKTVFNGTNEFIIEATALSISVSAKAKKKEGKKDPKNPEIASHFHSVAVIDFNLVNPWNK